MDVSFKGSALAALCNCEDRLAERWGTEAGRTIGRRLHDLVAADAGCLGLVPGARVEVDAHGETTITFGEAIVIKGIISAPDGNGRADQGRFEVATVRVIGVD